MSSIHIKKIIFFVIFSFNNVYSNKYFDRIEKIAHFWANVTIQHLSVYERKLLTDFVYWYSQLGYGRVMINKLGYENYEKFIKSGLSIYLIIIFDLEKKQLQKMNKPEKEKRKICEKIRRIFYEEMSKSNKSNKYLNLSLDVNAKRVTKQKDLLLDVNPKAQDDQKEFSLFVNPPF